MKIATVTRDYNFLINGFVVKKFEKNKSYIMSEMLMKDIMHAGGNKLFAAIRDIDNSVYKKYNGENLSGKTIAIWRTGGMGDLCFITPYLKKIKELYTDSKIIFGCGIQYSDVMSKHKYIDEFHNLPIDLDTLAKADYHLMFEGLIEGNKEAELVNAYDLFGKVFNIILEDNEKIPNLSVEEENLNFIKSLEEKFITVENPIKIGIHIKTSSIIRDVPVRFWKNLIYKLLNYDKRICIYLIGSQEDSEVGNQITIPTIGAGRVLPLYQVTRGFRDSVAAISLIDVIVGGDSSGLHIASAFEKPIIGLFGAFKSELRLKHYKRAIGIDAKTKCSPCFLHGNQPCDYSDFKGNSYCMMIFEDDKVIDEIMMLLHITNKIEINSLSPKAATVALNVFKEYMNNKQNKEETNGNS